MTERHGDEGGQRPSGRGAVTERLARRDEDASEIDLTDEATRSEAGDDTVVSPAARPDDQADRESSGAFEPAEPVVSAADPPAEAGRTGSSIFDVDERAKEEDLNRTGYEPPVADTADPDGPRGEVVVTEPGEPRSEPDATQPADATDATAPVADPPAEDDTPAAADTPADTPADAPAAAEAPAAPFGSLDTAGIRSRFLDIQAGFIDEPRQAVEEAGRFVDDLVRQVADALQHQRGQLAGATDEASTEDLRLALRAYRRFVDRLLGLGG
jgi:hypothetical protein